MSVTFRGRPACDCLAQWLPYFEAELLRRGVIKQSIDVAQLIGGAAASGGTHSTGGAFDIWQSDPVTIKVAREMGAATWARTRAQGFDPHAHGVLNGCPHNGPARYQIAALAAGYNGLGSGGRGARDDGPEPRQLRTWQQGIAWAKDQQPKTLPPRVQTSLAEILTEIKRIRAARETARKNGEPLPKYGEAIRALRAARLALRKVPKR